MLINDIPSQTHIPVTKGHTSHADKFAMVLKDSTLRLKLFYDFHHIQIIQYNLTRQHIHKMCTIECINSVNPTFFYILQNIEL